MKLLEFLQKESGISLRILVLMAGIAGISNAAILAIINTAAAQVASKTHSFQLLVLFTIAMSVYVLSQHYIMLTSAAEVEKVINRIRIRIADKVRHCDLLTLETLGRSEIYACVNRETLTLSQSATILTVGAQSAVLIFFTVLYIAWLSLTAFILSFVFTLAAVSTHFRQRRKLGEGVIETMHRENQFFDSLTGMLDGFKEVKMSRARSNDLFAHISEISASASQLKIVIQNQMAINFIFSQSTFYLLLATVVFIVPRFTPTYAAVAIATTTAILFLIGPISNLVGAIPVLARAAAACESIIALEERLDQGVDREAVTTPALTEFRQIHIQSVIFSYPPTVNVEAFSVGPFDLTVYAGEILFITGGNGSGKSTFMKLLTGLYPPSGGMIRVDGTALTPVTIDAYRQLFSVIFVDYHLFKRLYGLELIDPARIEVLLREMEIERKTRFVDHEFQTLDLSTGQKKRLALLVALLENKSIYVFDEWAADQDPHFRKKFYEEMLPQLKAYGKTVIAVSHDDRYYHVADRVIKMEEGRIMSIQNGVDYGG